MYESNLDHLLPSDNELVCRENVFLNLFDKFSVDEGFNPELVDFSDNVNIEEDASGSSLSETSSIDGESENSSVIKTIQKQLEPVIRKRVNAWPENGINLQLKTVDPSVSVEDWLRANQEFTTTTKSYKKTVINEDHKKITTTAKRMKTTTKKTSFNSFVPRFQLPPSLHHNEIKPNSEATSNDGIVLDSHSKKKKVSEKQTKRKDHVNTSKSGMKPKNLREKKVVDPSVIYKHGERNEERFTKSKQPINKKLIKSKAEKKISKWDVLPTVKRCLRPRLKENVVNQVVIKEEETGYKPLKVTSKKRNKKDNRVVDCTNDPPSAADAALEKKTASVYRSRSPLKEMVTDRSGNAYKLRSVRVNIEKMSEDSLTTTKSKAQVQKITIDQRSDNRAGIDCSKCVNNHIQAIKRSNSKCHSLSRRPKILINSMEVQQQQQIVIHSPNAGKILGTKIDDTLMLVRKSDYAKHIDTKCLQRGAVAGLSTFSNSCIVPMNRRFIYEPPMMDSIGENTDHDSECEDDLVLSYAKTGRITQLVDSSQVKDCSL